LLGCEYGKGTAKLLVFLDQNYLSDIATSDISNRVRRSFPKSINSFGRV
jgi:hypothetical protein